MISLTQIIGPYDLMNLPMIQAIRHFSNVKPPNGIDAQAQQVLEDVEAR